MKTKKERLQALLADAEALQAKMDGDEAERTEDNKKSFDGMLTQIEELQSEIVKENRLLGVKSFMTEPANAPKSNPNARPDADAEGSNYSPARVTEVKSIGQQFVESAQVKSMLESGHVIPEVKVDVNTGVNPFEQKATFTTTGTGVNTTVNYLPGVIDVRQQRLTIRDLLPVGQTTQNAITYIQETSFTNAATAVAEEGLKPEATFATQVASAPVKKIAVVGRVTDEMWQDVPQLRDYVDNRLRFMVQAREEAQLLSGTGVGANLTGITATSGIQTQAKATDTNFVAIHKAITKIRSVGFAEPDAIVINPTDWQLLKLATDANTQFYGGGPFMGQYGVGGYTNVYELWGLRAVVTTAIPAGTALVGAFRDSAMIWQREGMRVETTNSDASDFSYNRIAIRVEERLALAVYRPLGFCTVTGIA